MTGEGHKRFRGPPCVLLAGGAWGSALGMVRSIGGRGVDVYVLAVGVDASIYAASRFCRRARSIDLSADPEPFCRTVLDRLRSWRLPRESVLIPMTDPTATLTTECASALADHCRVVAPADDLLRTLLDKPRANALASACGLDVPRCGEVAAPGELDCLAGSLRPPVIVKPTWWRRRGEVSCKAAVCRTKEEILAVGTPLVDGGATLLLQEYIPGDDRAVEVYMFYRSRDGRAIRGCTGRKLRQSPPGAGNMAAGEAVWLPHVAEISRRFLDRIDYRGLGGIEYKRHEGRSYFIEVSARPEGFHPLAIRAGVDLPWHAYLDAAVDAMPPEPPRQGPACWLDGLYYLDLWRTSRRRVPVLREVAGLLMRPNTQCAVWSMRDPGPWLALQRSLARKARRKLLAVALGRKGRPPNGSGPRAPAPQRR